MKRKLMSLTIALLPALVVFMIVASSSTPTQAAPAAAGTTIITQWTFEGPGGISTTLPSTGSGNAISGTSLTGQSFPAGNLGSTFAWSFTGWSTGTLDANKYVEFDVSTAGYYQIGFRFDDRRSGTGPTVFQVHYSTDGITFAPFYTGTGHATNTWYTNTLDLSNIPGLNDNPNAKFRIYGYSASGTAGTWRVDNVTVLGGLPSVDLDVAKSGPSIATPGDTLNYTIFLSNTGNITATSTVVTDTLPAGVNFVTYTTALSPIFSQSGNDLIWNLGDVLSQTSGLTISVQVTVPTSMAAQTVLTNSVTASTTATETVTSNNTASVATTIRQADLIVSKVGPGVVMPGDLITYTVTVTNVGYPATSDLIITDTLPGDTTYVTDTTGVVPTTQPTNIYIWNLPGVSAGGVYSFSLKAGVGLAAPFGSLTNTVDVATSSPEESTSNNHAEWVLNVGGPDLVVSKQGPATAVPGEVIVYALTVSNTGSLPASQVWLTDTLPAKTNYYTDSLGILTSQNGQVYGLLTNTLASGKAITFMISVTVSPTAYANDILTNTAHVSEFELDSNLANNIATTAATVTGANPYVAQSASASTLFGGEGVTYTITYGNNGTDSASDLVLTNTLPTGFSYASDTSGFPAHVSGNIITWSLSVVNTAAPISFTLVATVTAGTSITQGTPVTNVVAIGPSVPGNNPMDDAASATGTVYQVVPIATARAGSTNQVFAIQGQVINLPGVYSASEWELQDDTGGIVIFYLPAPAVTLGDYVRMVAPRGVYASQQEMLTPTYYLNLGQGVPPAPRLYTTGQVAAGSAQGWLVTISGTLSALTNCSGNYHLSVNDGSGATDIYINAYSNPVINPCGRGFTNGDWVQITGFSTVNGSTYQVRPRMASDLIQYPRVLNVGPASGATDVALSANLTATFNTTMTNADPSTFLVQGPGGPVAGTVLYDAASKTATFTPNTNLAAGTKYTATLKSNLQAYNGASFYPAQDYVWTFTTHQTVPNLSTSALASPGQVVYGSSLVTYTFTLINTGDANATTTITDVLPSYYTLAQLLNFTQPTTGTLTWTGVVTAGQTVNVQFVARVNLAGQLSTGLNLLFNSATVNDGLHPVFTLDDPTPPLITIYGVYLPLVKR